MTVVCAGHKLSVVCWTLSVVMDGMVLVCGRNMTRTLVTRELSWVVVRSSV